MKKAGEIVVSQLQDASKTSRKMIETCGQDIQKAANLIVKAFKKEQTVFLCGNGGSASQAQHIAAEFINKFRIDRKPLPAIALTTDTSNLTSISNDSGFSYVFVRQLEALAKKGDILVILTTSDVSLGDKDFHTRNLGLALQAAKKLGLKTIGCVSEKTKKALPFLDIAIRVPSKDTPRIQEGHIVALHIICDLVEQELFG